MRIQTFHQRIPFQQHQQFLLSYILLSFSFSLESLSLTSISFLHSTKASLQFSFSILHESYIYTYFFFSSVTVEFFSTPFSSKDFMGKMIEQPRVELSKVAVSETHGENSPYFAGWKAYDENPYDELTNSSGVIQMGLAENQVS